MVVDLSSYVSHLTIYAICNHVSGAAYIGQSGEHAGRWAAHRTALRGGRHHNAALQADWDRDGETAFGLMILERVPRKSWGGVWASEQERRWCVRARAAGIVLYNDQVGREGRRKAA